MHRLKRPLLLILLIALLVRSQFAIAVLVALGSIWLIGSVLVRRGAANLRLTREVAARAFTGDRVVVRLRVENRGAIPVPWVEVHDSAPLALTMSKVAQRFVLRVPARAVRELSYELDCRRRGYYRLGPLTAQVGDVLGLKLRPAAAVPVDYLIVYPKVLAMPALQLPARAPVAAVSARSSLHRDPARIRGVRDYQSGDSLRQIHWSASASAGKLVVKQLDPTVARETMIVLDLLRKDYPRGVRRSAPELAVTLAASLASRILVDEQQPVGLAVFGRDPIARKTGAMEVPIAGDRDHLMVILEHLARVQTTHDGDFPAYFDRVVATLPWGCTIAAVTGRVNRQLRERMERARTMGFKPVLYLAGESPTRVDRAEFPIRGVLSEADLAVVS